mmetsp:Transcript_11234/g.16737  ORF Transcript_11234/g.16737 Transcript_11234/m.16737 type:complete len:95 (+) Transcript_11234:736-1020(+)
MFVFSLLLLLSLLLPSFFYTHNSTKINLTNPNTKIACFIILHLAVSIALLIKMKFNLKEYTRQSLLSFFTADLQKCGMSFMLFWTLFYGLVYLF